MGIFDKVKDITDKAVDKAKVISESAKEEYKKAKEENEQKKAERDAYRAEAERKARKLTEKIVQEVAENSDKNKKHIFETIDETELKNFAKEYYEKMVLPGSKASLSCILMYPYIDEKKVNTLKTSLRDYDEAELPILYIKDSEKQEFVFTKENFYFKIKYPDDTKLWCCGKLQISAINKFEVVSDETIGSFRVNGVQVAAIKICNIYKQDFMALNEFCRMILENDFNISAEEIDKLIRQKIGNKIHQNIKKYMVYDDELVMYYAGGSDSLLALDYIACTTKQIIIVNREVFGATANIKQFYYEDITSMATIQNSNSSDLIGYIIDTALTAALKICDLVITVAGSTNKINTLYTVEAERVVAIYHQYRKEAKIITPAVSNIIQQSEPDAMDQLVKLSQLKENGVITEAEYNEKRMILLDKIK
jgi:hypothetical protein